MNIVNIYTKEELISNNWEFAYIEISVKDWYKDVCAVPDFELVEKINIGLTNEAAYAIAKAYVKNFFEMHPELNINHFNAYVNNGNALGSCIQSISIYHLFK